jgi:hypothetical protein
MRRQIKFSPGVLDALEDRIALATSQALPTAMGVNVGSPTGSTLQVVSLTPGAFTLNITPAATSPTGNGSVTLVTGTPSSMATSTPSSMASSTGTTSTGTTSTGFSTTSTGLGTVGFGTSTAIAMTGATQIAGVLSSPLPTLNGVLGNTLSPTLAALISSRAVLGSPTAVSSVSSMSTSFGAGFGASLGSGLNGSFGAGFGASPAFTGGINGSFGAGFNASPAFTIGGFGTTSNVLR